MGSDKSNFHTTLFSWLESIKSLDFIGCAVDDSRWRKRRIDSKSEMLVGLFPKKYVQE